MTASPNATPTNEQLEADATLGALEHALRTAGKRVFCVLPGDPAGIDRSGYVVLASLVRTGPTRLSDVAAALELDPSTVSRQVRQLDAAGLIERREDPADRRAALLVATTAGERVHFELRRRRIELLETALADWSQADRHELVRLAERLGEALHAIGPVA